MSSRSLSPTVRRPRIHHRSSSATISPASSAAALIPRSVSHARSQLSSQQIRSLSPSSRQNAESYTLWQPILRGSDQIVLYNPESHAIDIVPASLSPVSSSFTLPYLNGHRSPNGPGACPYCHRPMDNIPGFSPNANTTYGIPRIEMSPDYFQLLQRVNGGAIDEHNPPTPVRPSFARFEEEDDSSAPSRRWSRVSIDSDSDSDGPSGSAGGPESLKSLSGGSLVNGSSATPLGRSTTHLVQPSAAYAQPGERESSEEPEDGPRESTSKSSSGYYSTFFREETRLGMGANGSVFLCQHVLNGIPLGHFAVKKIAVGESTSYLMEILREVRLHEKLHHRNIITYHHAWLESARFSSFGLAVPTLHVLMQWAELGSLDDLILQRLGAKSAPDRAPESSEAPSGEYQTREDRIRAFRARAGGAQQQTANGDARREARRWAREMKAVHLLSAEEIRSLFGDVVAGLAFLHESSFLHLDLKPGNVLLTLDEGELIPRAMLSDFGTAQDALQSAARPRSGNTGTLEYSAPESLGHSVEGSLRQATSKSDMWSLGMILHKLVYFRLPWKNDDDLAELEKEIIDFQGFRASSENIRSFTQRRLPVALCQLLSKLLDVDPFQRPGSDQVLKAIRGSQLDPMLPQQPPSPNDGVGPLVRRPTPPPRRNGSRAARYDTDVLISGEPGEDSSLELPSPVGRTRAASSSRAGRSDPVGEMQMGEITPRLLALDGPAPAVRRVAGLVSSINVSRVLARGFKSALLISKTVLLINRCAPTPPRVAALCLVIGLALIDMWTRRLRWSCALLVAHLGLLWAASRETVCMDVDDPDMEMDSEEELEEEVDGSGESQMEVEEENRIRWVPVARPVDRPYGRPRLDELPPTVLYRIVRHMIGDIGATLAFRMTCKALKKIVAETPDLWWKHAQYLRGRTQMLFAPDPVVLPGHLVPAFQEELLRCAFILNYKWTNPAFRALSVNRKAGSQWSPHGVEQASFFSILFVPDSAGRYFLTVSRVDVHLWTLEPNSLPRMCRRIFPRANALLGEKESIVNALVSRPQGPIPGSPKSMVSYLAIQYTLKDSSRLRTEIYQLHLSPPGADLGPGFGLCGIHMTEGSLVAFTDFVLAYALGDAAQTILLCCWVTRQATRLVTPVREWEVRWQHQSCRAVTIGLDIIIVVRDSTAEVYPRAGFTLLEESEWPRRILYTPIEGDLEYLPTIYATDIAVFPCNFTKTPKIHIHQPRAAASVSEGVAIELCVQPISLIGVARSSVPLSEPHVPYYVETAKLFKTYTPWPTPYMSGAPTPSVSATPSPSHTAPPSPSHTASYPVTMPLPEPERYKFVFHVHALQPQHPRWDYGPILAGPNGRGVILASNIGVGPGPRQFLAKFRHPSNEELRMMVWPDANMVMNPVPRPFRVPQANGANGPPQPTASAPIPVQQVLPAIPPQIPPQIPPAMHPHPHGMGPMIHPPPPPDPFAPLMALMRPVAPLDILQKMSFLWTTNDTFRYELLAWDEGGGTLILGTKRGDLEIIECAFPPPPPLPRAQTGRAHP